MCFLIIQAHYWRYSPRITKELPKCLPDENCQTNKKYCFSVESSFVILDKLNCQTKFCPLQITFAWYRGYFPFYPVNRVLLIYWLNYVKLNISIISEYYLYWLIRPSVLLAQIWLTFKQYFCNAKPGVFWHSISNKGWEMGVKNV